MLDIERIGKMRRQLGLTQKQLANLAGVSQSLIAKIESGNIDPAYSKVMQINEALSRELNKGKKSVEQIMSGKIVSVSPTDTLHKAASVMRAKDISQLPVMEDGKCVGSLSDSLIVDLLASCGTDIRMLSVRDTMRESFPVVPFNSLADVAVDLLRHYSAVLVGKEGKIVGIITKADLLKAI